MSKGGAKIDCYKTTFGCSLCDYIVNGEKGIRLHMKYTHNIKNFKQQTEFKFIKRCDICGKTFKRNIDVRKHTFKNHQNM